MNRLIIIRNDVKHQLVIETESKLDHPSAKNGDFLKAVTFNQKLSDMLNSFLHFSTFQQNNIAPKY